MWPQSTEYESLLAIFQSSPDLNLQKFLYGAVRQYRYLGCEHIQTTLESCNWDSSNVRLGTLNRHLSFRDFRDSHHAWCRDKNRFESLLESTEHILILYVLTLLLLQTKLYVPFNSNTLHINWYELPRCATLGFELWNPAMYLLQTPVHNWIPHSSNPIMYHSAYSSGSAIPLLFSGANTWVLPRCGRALDLICVLDMLW